MEYQKEKSGKNPIRYSNKKIKYLQINLTKDVKDLFSDNYTTLKKEIKDDTNKCNHILCSWIGRTNIIKMLTLTKPIYRFNTIQMAYFTDLEQIFQTFIWTNKGPDSLSNLEKTTK